MSRNTRLFSISRSVQAVCLVGALCLLSFEKSLCLYPCYCTSTGRQDWGTAHGSAPLLAPAQVLCDRGGVTGVTSEPKFQFLPLLSCYLVWFFFFSASGSASLPASCSGPAHAVILERKLKNIAKTGKCCLSLVRSPLTCSNLTLSSLLLYKIAQSYPHPVRHHVYS